MEQLNDSSADATEKVCILALNKRSWHHSKAGGSELNLEESLKRLAERGHRVHLLTGSDEGNKKREVDGGVYIHRVGFDNWLSAPWDVVTSYIFVTFYFYFKMFKISPDIVYTVNTPLPWPVVTRCPRIAIFHHIAIDSFFDTHPFPQNLLGYISQWAGVLRERNTPTVSVSPSTTKELVSRGHPPDTVYEIRNGIDLEKYFPGNESNNPQMVYIGGLERYKGVDRIPEIHQELQALSEQDIHLHVAGRDGPMKELIETYCENTNKAHFHGFVSEEKKIQLLQSGWAFIAPSRVEGWGIAVLEANACGTPAIGCDVSGLRDSIKHQQTGFLVDEFTAASFASNVHELISNRDLRNSFGDSGRAWAEQHSWERNVDDLERLFLMKS
ncbi:glycosyl transferase family 1 [Haloarcula mannanilytica]|uniref:Glycosyl transferase family 1 n=1 Tax=Haloarcula mannanilytica TaxID=2509225 RepID=A0A4C2ELH4_9EURY|nr:glycosyltransferase family 4 protein [Haloarcula mannanilytica]GCF15401.1 glycosyl transferase family 1 [Haloarcula mannanilytica]